MTETQERSVPKPVFTDAEAGAKVFPDSDARHFNYFHPKKRKQSHYEDVTVEVQPDPRHYLTQGWLYGFSDGRGGYPLDWTVLKAWGTDRPVPERFPGSGGKGCVTSPTNCLLASSMHTTGSSAGRSDAYRSKTSSIFATNRALSRSGMHQHCFRHGRSAFFSAPCGPSRR